MVEESAADSVRSCKTNKQIDSNAFSLILSQSVLTSTYRMW